MVLKPFKATRASIFALNHINVSDCRTTSGSSDAFPPAHLAPAQTEGIVLTGVVHIAVEAASVAAAVDFMEVGVVLMVA